MSPFLSSKKMMSGLLLLICAALLATDFILPRRILLHVEALPGFYALAGFVVAIGIVMAAAFLAKVMVYQETSHDD